MSLEWNSIVKGLKRSAIISKSFLEWKIGGEHLKTTSEREEFFKIIVAASIETNWSRKKYVGKRVSKAKNNK